MKSYWMQVNGEQAAIELRDVPQPEPGAGQLLLRVRAAGLNRGEFIIGHGLTKAGAAKAVGMEAAGDVVACGSGVHAWKVGDRVMGRCNGAFAEYVLLDQREAMAVPARLTWEQAGAVPLTSLVVHDMLVLQGHLKPGQWVLVPGVTSGVGVTALSMAKALGARVIGTSGSADKLARLQPLGLDLALHTRQPDFHTAVMQATDNKGVNLVVNTVGGSVFAECVRSMAFEGRMAIVGYVDGQLKAEIDLETVHAKRLTIFGVSNKLRTMEQRTQGVPAFVEQILPLIASGHIQPLIDKVFPFEQLAEAKSMMDGSAAVGKIVLRVLP
jgi:NADPH:quinone reductase-like Zn-dependent oxidoreductase